MDWATLNGASLTTLIILVGAGYVLGMIMDSAALWWSRLFRPRNTKALMLQGFERRHPQLQVNFEPKERDILFWTVKEQEAEAALDIERYNVMSIMLRNISLGLALLALVYVAYFVLWAGSGWNLVLAVGFLLFAVLAARHSKKMREWFYTSTFEVAAARALKDFAWVEQRPIGTGVPDTKEARSSVQG